MKPDDALTVTVLSESLEEAFERLAYVAGTLLASPDETDRALGLRLDSAARVVAVAKGQLRELAEGLFEQLNRLSDA